MKHLYLLLFVTAVLACSEEPEVDNYAWARDEYNRTVVKEKAHYVEKEELVSHDGKTLVINKTAYEPESGNILFHVPDNPSITNLPFIYLGGAPVDNGSTWSIPVTYGRVADVIADLRAVNGYTTAAKTDSVIIKVNVETSDIIVKGDLVVKGQLAYGDVEEVGDNVGGGYFIAGAISRTYGMEMTAKKAGVELYRIPMGKAETSASVDIDIWIADDRKITFPMFVLYEINVEFRTLKSEHPWRVVLVDWSIADGMVTWARGRAGSSEASLDGWRYHARRQLF